MMNTTLLITKAKIETQLAVYQKIFEELEQVLNAEKDINKWSLQIWENIQFLERQLSDIEEEQMFNDLNMDYWESIIE